VIAGGETESDRITPWLKITPLLYIAMALGCLVCPVSGGEKKEAPKPAPVPVYNPAKQPVVTGEFLVGLITVTFKESAIEGSLGSALKALDVVSGTHQEADSGGPPQSAGDSSGTTQEVYFKTYSNGIAWPKLVVMPAEESAYQDPHFYGYYCEYDYWGNPMGWKDRQEGAQRVEKMNKEALAFANKSYRGAKPRFICYNYVTTRPKAPEKELTAALLQFYEHRDGKPDRTIRKSRGKNSEPEANALNPWTYYAPTCKWGEPMWPNSKIQINDFSGGVLAHELGHCLGAPDLYRVGRFNDGISGEASLLSYGPTANAFSRFYHHAYIKPANHPIIKASGSYTLHPRHIDPKGNEAVGYLIPSNHPHYFYHVEYIHRENSTVGVGSRYEGMLISAVNLGVTSYLGSPDFFYVYRPGDPFFRGKGDTADCLFGKSHGRTEFNMTTEPSSRLPNLLDGGVSFKNIEEKGETLTFDVLLEPNRITGSAYTNSMLPQIRLDGISNVQPTSFAMECTIKFRGEPLKTAYGFCWSTSKAPTVRDATFALAHRESYRGHAIHLSPNTTYYVRAFATNGLGVRYSDEEKLVKTPDLKTPPPGIEPLCVDYFSNNRYLFESFSVDNSDTFIGYSPTCVLAKLISYYRPVRFASTKAGSKPAAVDFNQLSWNPGMDDNPARLAEVKGFFQTLCNQSQQLKFHDAKPPKDFLGSLVKLTGFRSKPVLSELRADNLNQVTELIRNDLRRSRPVVVLFAFTGYAGEPMRWALIDGINGAGRLHVDIPGHTKFLVDAEWKEKHSGELLPGDLILPSYQTFVVTSCYDLK
jgi:hypothetical protein